MDKDTYRAWWALHIRAVRRETLSPDERERYEAGLRELESEEDLSSSIGTLREARDRTMRLKSELDRLRREYRALERRAAAAEARLSESARDALGIGG